MALTSRRGGEDDVEVLDRMELDSLQKVFERLDRKNDGKIDKDEITQQFEELGYRPKKVCNRGMCVVGVTVALRQLHDAGRR